MSNLLYAINVMQAALDGKRIQYRDGSFGWQDVDVRHWPWYGPESLRIAPQVSEPRKPREWLLGEPVAQWDRNQMTAYPAKSFIVTPSHMIRVREVIE